MVVETCSGLMRAGHEVAIAYHDTHPATVSCQVFHVPEAQPMPARKGALDAAIAKFQPEVIHNHSTKILPLLPALSERFPLATFCHDQSLFCSGGDRSFRGWQPCHRPHGLGCLAWHYLGGCGGKDPRNNWRLWRTIPDRMTAWGLPRTRMQVASKFMRSGLLENRFPAERIDLVPLFAEQPPETGVAIEAKLLLVPARLVRSKGVDLALRAFAQLAIPGARLVVAGAGPEREPLERLSRQLGTVGQVLFTGELSPDGLADWYARAGLVLFPVLRPEPFGLVGVEALAHGKPIVAVAGGAVEEWLWPGETGLRVDERTPEAFAAAVRELLLSPERCAEMGAAAKARYAYFHPSAYVERLMAAFERTIQWHRDIAR